MSRMFLTLCLILITSFSVAQSPLAPVKLDSARDTMSTYVAAMNDYVEGLKTGDRQKLARIKDAVRTFNLQHLPYLARDEKGIETAILLKEVIDRVIIIDLDKVPENPDQKYWRLKDTEIAISQVQEGERMGQFLFTQDTVSRMREFYQKVRHLPYLDGTSQGAGYRESLAQRYFPKWMRGELLGIEKWQWAGVFLAILLGFLIKVVTEFVIALFKRFTSKVESSLRHRIILALEKPGGLIAATGFWFFSIHLMDFEGAALNVLLTVTQIILSVALVWAAYRLSDICTDFFHMWAAKTESELDDQLVPLLSKSLRIFVLVIGVLVAIQNLGFNVMSLLAGLGIGGLAFALAAKDTAANLFGSIMILLDQPFKVGDWIVTSDVEGKVEEIGLRSTRIRTFYNSLVSVPNSLLATTNIDNMGLREYRRTKFLLGITYDTPAEKMEAFLEGVKNIIKANPLTRKDFFHVVFDGYGDFSLNILVYYFFRAPDWATELVERQNINLEILRLAKELGVQFAFPTQTLHVDTFPEKGPVSVQSVLPESQLKDVAKKFGPNGEQSRPSGLGIFVPPFKE